MLCNIKELVVVIGDTKNIYFDYDYDYDYFSDHVSVDPLLDRTITFPESF